MISTSDPAEVARAGELLRAGALVAIPTETVYGLAANALDPQAVRRIYELKGRPSTSPLIVHVASIEQARSLASEWPDAAGKLARAFWPGPLTIVVPKRPDLVPDSVTAGLATVGLRMPSHPVALAIIRAAGVPLAAPSANRFTELSPTTAAHVRRAFAGDPRLELVIDGGPCQVGIESTVIAVTPCPVLLRPGMVTAAEIEAALGGEHLESPGASAPAGDAHASPGLHAKHYSPRTPLYLQGEGIPPASARRIARLPLAAMPSTPEAYAAALYATLHRLDEEGGYDAIVVEPPPDTPRWAAVRDRLTRAAFQPSSQR